MTNRTSQIIDELGGPTEVARKLGIKWPSTITNWIARDQIPVERAPEIETASGGSVKCEQIRPDIAWTRDRAKRVTGYTVRIKDKAA